MHAGSVSFVALALAAGLAGAAEQELKPFVLASRGPGEPEQVAEEAKAKLAAAGFEVVGSLRGYHYMMAMPCFDDPWELARFPSQAEALAAVEAGLAEGRGKTRKVYRVDVSPDETVFGVALADGCGADANVMKEIDVKPLRSTGHLPYEVVVSKGDVLALHAKFRIAVNFPDLSMMGDHSFMRIRCAPDSIEGALQQVVGKR